LFELSGRFWLKMVADFLSFSELRGFLARMGDVFWFEQTRHLTDGTVASIRQELINWWAYQPVVKPGEGLGEPGGCTSLNR